MIPLLMAVWGIVTKHFKKKAEAKGAGSFLSIEEGAILIILLQHKTCERHFRWTSIVNLNRG